MKTILNPEFKEKCFAVLFSYVLSDLKIKFYFSETQRQLLDASRDQRVKGACKTGEFIIYIIYTGSYIRYGVGLRII